MIRVDLLHGQGPIGEESFHALAHGGRERLVTKCLNEQGRRGDLVIARFRQFGLVPRVQRHDPVSVQRRMSSILLVLFKHVVQLRLVGVQPGSDLAAQSFEIETFSRIKDGRPVLLCTPSSEHDKVTKTLITELGDSFVNFPTGKLDLVSKVGEDLDDILDIEPLSTGSRGPRDADDGQGLDNFGVPQGETLTDVRTPIVRDNDDGFGFDAFLFSELFDEILDNGSVLLGGVVFELGFDIVVTGGVRTPVSVQIGRCVNQYS
jgi:hypothetical protein